MGDILLFPLSRSSVAQDGSNINLDFNGKGVFLMDSVRTILHYFAIITKCEFTRQMYGSQEQMDQAKWLNRLN